VSPTAALQGIAPPAAAGRPPGGSGLSLTLLAALGLQVIFGLTAWFIPTALNSDSAFGFYVWDSWRAGAPWNQAIYPLPADIARTTSVFQAWWSPGQYLVAAPWQWTGLSLGHAIAVGGSFASAIAIAGFWILYRDSGFSRPVAGWSVLALACNWTLTRTYGDYLGGEIALLAVLPWLLLATRKCLRAGGWGWIAVSGICWLGAMAKNTYLPIGAGLIAGFRGEQLLARPGRGAARVAEAARWIACLALGYFLYWATYLRLGTSPGSALGGTVNPDAWFNLLRLPGYPVSCVFSLGTIIGRIFLHPDHPLVAEQRELWPLYLATTVSALAVLWVLLKREFTLRPAWARMLAGVIAANLGFYLLILLWRDAEGMDERFFKPVGFLLLPAVVDFVRSGRPRWTAGLLGAALMLSSAYGLAAWANRTHYLTQVGNAGRRGITQHVLSRQALQVLQAIDTALPPNSLVVVPSPEMALEMRRTRVMPTHAIMMPAAFSAQTRYQGRVPDLVILVNHRMLAQGRAQALLGSFVDYAPAGWTVHAYGDWLFYQQGDFSDWPRPTP